MLDVEVSKSALNLYFSNGVRRMLAIRSVRVGSLGSSMYCMPGYLKVPNLLRRVSVLVLSVSRYISPDLIDKISVRALLL